MTEVAKKLADALENVLGFGINQTMESQMAQDDAKAALALYTASHSTPEPGAVSDDVVERVARAIYAARERRGKDAPTPWEYAGAPLQQGALEDARAAIAAYLAAVSGDAKP